MRFFYLLPILLLISMVISIEKANAQEKLSDFRNNYAITYKFGLADGKETKKWAKNSHSIQLERSFALNKLLSISPVLAYSHFGGSSLSKDNTISVGGNIGIYPLYLAYLINGDPYEAKKDKMYFNVGLQKTINNAAHTLVFNVDLNIYNFNLGKHTSLSPNLGFQHFISSDQAVGDVLFYTIGLNLTLPKF